MVHGIDETYYSIIAERYLPAERKWPSSVVVKGGNAQLRGRLH